MHHRIEFLIVLMVLSGAAPAGAATGERADLLPRHVYWQDYPSDVRTVKIDRDGRPWFEMNGVAPIDEMKRQVERSAELQAPWVKGAKILLFDSADRVWLMPSPDLLLGFDPKTREWLEHSTGAASASDRASGEFAHALCGAAIEDGDGRVFFADRNGCHVLHHGTWSYQAFYGLNYQKNRFFGDSHDFYPPMFVRDEHGRIYAWTPWGWNGTSGTLGFWECEHGRWRQLLTEAGERPGRLSAVVPLHGGRALVCPEVGRVFVTRVDSDDQEDPAILREDIQMLGASGFKRRREAERRVLERGPHVLPLLRRAMEGPIGPEQRARLVHIVRLLEHAPPDPQVDGYTLSNARVWGRDTRGNTVLWADAIGPGEQQGRTAAWLVSADGDVAPAPTPIARWNPRSMLADARGDLFLGNYQHGLGVIDQGKLVRLNDDCDLPLDELLGEDRDGRVYAHNQWQTVAIDRKAPDTRRGLAVSVFDLAGPRGVACKDSRGRTFAKLAGAAHPFLSVFEHGGWSDIPVPKGGHPLADLTFLQPLSEGALLAQESPGGEAYFFDGRRWSACRNLRQLVETHYGPLCRLIDRPNVADDQYTGLWIDGGQTIRLYEWGHLSAYDGRQWQQLPVDPGKRTSRSGGSNNQSNGYKDSSGRFWDFRPATRQLVLSAPDGHRTEIAEDALYEDTRVVEDKPGSYWINTRRGLRHLIQDPTDPVRLSPDDFYYERGVPKTKCNGMWLDAAGSLWWSGIGQLYRIPLP